MSEDKKCMLVVSAFIVATTFMLGGAIGHAICQNYIRAEAIEAGAAEYVCDPTTGDVTFEWKENQ